MTDTSRRVEPHLADKYESVLKKYTTILDVLRNWKPTDRVTRPVEPLLDDIVTLLACWGADVNIGSKALEDIEQTAVALGARASLLALEVHANACIHKLPLESEEEIAYIIASASISDTLQELQKCVRPLLKACGSSGLNIEEFIEKHEIMNVGYVDAREIDSVKGEGKEQPEFVTTEQQMGRQKHSPNLTEIKAHDPAPVQGELINSVGAVPCEMVMDCEEISHQVERFHVNIRDPNLGRSICDLATKRLRGRSNFTSKMLYLWHGHCTVFFNGEEKCAKFFLANIDAALRDAVAEFIGRYGHTNFKFSFKLHFAANVSGPVPDSRYDALLRNGLFIKKKVNWEGAAYIPEIHFNALLSDDAIEYLLEEDASVRQAMGTSVGWSERLQTFTQEVLESGRRLLALCVYTGLDLRYLRTFLGAGFDDNHMPFNERDFKFFALSLSDNNIKFETLEQQQTLFTAHHFSNTKAHEQIDPKAVLPILGTKEKSFIGCGAFADVFKITIEPGYHEFSQDPNEYFALKKFKLHPQIHDIYHRELAMLETLSDFAHSNLVTHLGTWSQRDKFYILFPLADGNLRNYMRMTPAPAPRAGFVKWLFKQFLGLSDAVNYLHNPSPRTLGSQPSYVGFHHDIKPDNVLVFTDLTTSEVTWKLGDFSSGRIFTFAGRGEEEHYAERPMGDPTYEPPDFYRGKRVSRPYDMWSLGCLFLEILTWVWGHDIRGFEDRRIGDLKLEIDVDFFSGRFWYRIPGDTGQVALNPAVVSQLQLLEEDCRQRPGFEELLRSIKALLHLNASERLKAPGLCSNIQAARRQVDKAIDANPNCYLQERDATQASGLDMSTFFSIRTTASTAPSTPGLMSSSQSSMGETPRSVTPPTPLEDDEERGRQPKPWMLRELLLGMEPRELQERVERKRSETGGGNMTGTKHELGPPPMPTVSED